MDTNSFSEKIKKKAQKSLSPYLYGAAYSRAAFTVWGLAIQECRSSFRQFFVFGNPFFSFFRAVKYFTYGCLRVVTGRSIRISYGYKAEDRLIESLLKPIITQNGFYVEVGCNEPRFASNTFLFYKRGWRGICIDADERLIEKHKKVRPMDQAFCSFVSDVETDLEYTEMDNKGLSSGDSTHVQNALNKGYKITNRKKMKSLRLTTILEQLKAPSNFDFLSVDTEGNDYKVLQSLDFERYSPRLIIVEADHYNPSNPSEHEIYKFLIAKNYFFHGSILTNLYFLKDKEEVFS
jgi:FkbM family methyltransferase